MVRLLFLVLFVISSSISIIRPQRDSCQCVFFAVASFRSIVEATAHSEEEAARRELVVKAAAWGQPVAFFFERRAGGGGGAPSSDQNRV